MSTGEKDESVSKTYITQVKDLRLQIEDVETRTIARMRQPVDKDPLKDCFRKTAEQTVPLLYIYSVLRAVFLHNILCWMCWMH